ncbi:unnamed protein product [Soboliphyme baturini]|uniref:Protein phosphatase inhibitor 2 n=1 Tax=Soboliphyme baturini TaxID=241478 RepID=A0A183IUM2_9BILA|nr:unnamed protein product [Soboliphyme baturini]
MLQCADAASSSETESENETETDEERARRKAFEMKRKQHYDEFRRMKLAKQLIEKDLKTLANEATDSTANDTTTSSRQGGSDRQ